MQSSGGNTIVINHAYNGFLYAPLFLASDLGFLPKCTRLQFRNGDAECLDQLCSYSPGTEKNWFAICDPFSVDLSTKVPVGDEICVVGCLLDRLPVWVINTDTEAVRLGEESDLANRVRHVRKIVCYKEATTGYLIGKRLQGMLHVSDSNLLPCDFGQEFSGQANGDTAIVTADILRIVSLGPDHRHVLFDYPARSPDELKPFLFTGILTLRNEVLNDNLWIVLTLLAGLKKAIDLLSSESVPPECIDSLTRHFDPQIGSLGCTTPDEKRTFMTKAIHYTFRQANLYSHTLRPEKVAWENAQRQWEGVMGRSFANVEERHEPIPALLIRKDWKKDAELRAHINKGFVALGSLAKSGLLRWYHFFTLALAPIVSLLVIWVWMNTLRNATLPIRDQLGGVILGSGFLVGFVAWVAVLSMRLLRGKTEHYLGLLSFSAGFFMASLFAIVGIIK